MQSLEGKERAAVRRIARGAVQTLSSAYAGRVVTWIAIVVLTRELPPEDFGQIALAASMLAVVGALRSFGLHNALLHRYDRVDDLAPTHFFLNSALAVLGAVGAIAWAVLFVDSRGVATALAVFAAFDLLRATALTAETQLRRDLEFGSLAGAHALALVTAAASGIALAFLGAGMWALILSHSVYGIGYVVVYSAMLWRRRSPLSFRLSGFRPDEARRMFGYGAWIWLGTMLQAFVLNFDRFVVNHLLDLGTLGFYERAHVFAQVPTGAITHALTGVMLAVFARYQQDREQLAGAFRRALRLIMRLAVPLSLLVAIEIPVLTRLLLDESWLPMASILRWLILFSLCRPLLEAVHALLRSIGDPRGSAAFVGVQAALLLVAAPLLTRSHAIEGTAMAMSLAALVGTIIALHRSSRFVEVPWLRSIAPPLLAAGAATGARLAAGPLIEPFPTTLAFLLGGGLFVFSYGAALLCMEGRALLSEVRTLFRTLHEERIERKHYGALHAHCPCLSVVHPRLELSGRTSCLRNRQDWGMMSGF